MILKISKPYKNENMWFWQQIASFSSKFASFWFSDISYVFVWCNIAIESKWNKSLFETHFLLNIETFAAERTILKII